MDPWQIAMMRALGLEPEWSVSKQTYQPMDSGWQRDQMSQVEDALRLTMDPAFMFLAGGFNPESLDPTFEEEIEPAVTEGRDTLEAVLRTSPGSPQAIIAAALLEEKTPEQALALLGLERPMPTEENPRPDTSTYDRLLKFADQSWQGLLKDREEKVTRTEIPNPHLQKLQAAGYSDPRQQYTADFFANQQSDRLGQQASAAQIAMERARGMLQQAQQPLGAATPSGPPSGPSSFPFQVNPRDFLSAPTDDTFVAARQSQGRAPRGRAAPGRQRETQTRERFRGMAEQTAGKTYRRARTEHGVARARAAEEEAKRIVLANMLQREGRTPFRDEFMARVGSIPGIG